MRIISGTFKARRIMAPKKLPVRPTTDMAKEALFNILNHRYHFHDISVLDLFSGTGNISYEFASRGTESIVAVDQNFHCTKFISQTSEGFDMPIQVIKADVFGFLEKTKQPQTIIFADPPYELELGGSRAGTARRSRAADAPPPSSGWRRRARTRRANESKKTRSTSIY